MDRINDNQSYFESVVQDVNFCSATINNPIGIRQVDELYAALLAHACKRYLEGYSSKYGNI